MTKRSMPPRFKGPARVYGFSLSLPKHRRCLDPNLPKRDRFILVGIIWANVAVYRNVVVENVPNDYIA